MKLLDPNLSYTFSKIFELKLVDKDLAAEFGYTLDRKRLELPQYSETLDRLSDLQNRIEEILPYASLSTETARRELLVSPVILDLIHYTKAEIRIEYPIKVTEQLQGFLDYFFQGQHQFLIVEAKKEDLEFGFTQLVAQMIALDQWDSDHQTDPLIGAITTGKIWEFGRLDRLQKHIERGINSYRVPDDLEPLMRILVQSLID